MYRSKYASPFGDFILSADEEGLCGVFPAKDGDAPESARNKILIKTAEWLDAYFSGKPQGLKDLPLSPQGSDFCLDIWELLCGVPYGAVLTYGELAARYEKETGKKTSPRAVGRAVSKNPILIIIPCHRVVGTNGALTGYSGGLPLKKALLEYERKNR